MHRYDPEHDTEYLKNILQEIGGENALNQETPKLLTGLIKKYFQKKHTIKEYRCLWWNVCPSPRSTSNDDKIGDFLVERLNNYEIFFLQEVPEAAHQKLKSTGAHIYTSSALNINQNTTNDPPIIQACIVLKANLQLQQVVLDTTGLFKSFLDTCALNKINALLKSSFLVQMEMYRIFGVEQVYENHMRIDTPWSGLSNCTTYEAVLRTLLIYRSAICKIDEETILVSYHALHNALSRSQKMILTLLFFEFWKFVSLFTRDRILIAGDYNITLERGAFEYKSDRFLYDLILDSYASETYFYEYMKKFRMISSSKRRLDYVLYFKKDENQIKREFDVQIQPEWLSIPGFSGCKFDHSPVLFGCRWNAFT